MMLIHTLLGLFYDFPASLKCAVRTALQFKNTHTEGPSAKHTVLDIYSKINRKPSVLSGILIDSYCTCTRLGGKRMEKLLLYSAHSKVLLMRREFQIKSYHFRNKFYFHRSLASVVLFYVICLCIINMELGWSLSCWDWKLSSRQQREKMENTWRFFLLLRCFY